MSYEFLFVMVCVTIQKKKIYIYIHIYVVAEKCEIFDEASEILRFQPTHYPPFKNETHHLHHSILSCGLRM